MLRTRVASACVLIPIVGVALYLGGIYWFILVLAAGLLASYEYVTLLRSQGLRPSYSIVFLLTILFVLDGRCPDRGLIYWTLAFVPLLALAVEVFHGNAPGSLHNWSLAVSGGVYIGFAISNFIRLRALDHGFDWLVLALLGTWIYDSGAYFIGTRFGKHGFFHKISPKKTWKGAIGGLFLGVSTVVIVGLVVLGLGMGWGLLLGVLLVLGATFGDLSVSVIKRQVGAKDSGNLIPGHGGMLDRVDSLLFVVPIVYYFAISLAKFAR